jgi:excisionase family DNA binding protein
VTDSLPRAEPTYRTAEVARALGVSPRAIRVWADAGKISCYRTFGGHRLFPISEVRRVLEQLRSNDRIGSEMAPARVAAR